MKCATPGKYGRKVPIESSTIRDDFIDQKVFNDVDHNLTSEEIKKELKAYWEKLYISYGRGSGKTHFQEQKLKEYMEQLLQKDKEEHEND